MRNLVVCAGMMAISQAVAADEFTQDDRIIILVFGESATSKVWGFSGKATMYRATSTQGTGNLGFSAVEGTEGIPCERRSAKKVLKPTDYSKSGQIPPGIYFVSYHRLDPKGNRHRLAIGDVPSGTEINIKLKNSNVKRTNIQFHEASNDLRSYKPNLSEGCIIFSRENFFKLFPQAFLAPETSPLAPSKPKIENAKNFKGSGHVLVFVTDIVDTEVNKEQLELFESVLQGGEEGLSPSSFDNDESLQRLRTAWAIR